MTVNIYDGNNVMLRDLFKPKLGAERPMSMRQRYESMAWSVPGTQIWCWDGKDHNERRKEIYPGYKADRPPLAIDIYSQVQLWRKVLKNAPVTQIEVEGWEADDVVGTLVRKFAAKGVPVRVHTNDMDYGQLLHLGNVTLDGVNMKGVPGRWVPLYKAMVGDQSDRISGVPGFGPGRWLEMENHWAEIESAIVANDPAGFVGLPFKPAVKLWLTNPENIKLLRAMLTVTHLENVPDDELDGGVFQGVLDRDKAHSMLSEFYL